MIRARSTRALTALALAGGLLVASQASAAPAAGDTQFFLRQDGCGAANPQQPGRLSTTAGSATEDTSHGCGTIGGLPLTEVLATGLDTPPTPQDYTTENGVPLVLDASRDVEGVLTTRSWTGGVGGVGDVVFEVRFTGVYTDARGRKATAVLGEGSFSSPASPTKTTNPVPFTFDVDDKWAGVTFSALTLSTAQRGANVNAGGQSLRGTSHVTVPTIVDDAAV